MDATATPRGISVRMIIPLAKGVSLRPSIVIVDSVLVTRLCPRDTRTHGPAPHTACLASPSTLPILCLGLVLQRCLVRSSGVLPREGCRREGRGYLSPLCY